MPDFLVPDGRGTAEITEKKSKFIAFAFPASSEEEVGELLSELRKRYWDARHIVYAYTLPDGVSRSSDDGEPHGTAGKPLLTVLTVGCVRGCLLVVVRYFGGVLLGTGGLVRAYGEAGRLALENAGLARLTELVSLSVECGYEDYGRLSELCTAEGASELVAEFAERVGISFLLPEESLPEFEKKLTNAFCGGMVLKKQGKKTGKLPLFTKK